MEPCPNCGEPFGSAFCPACGQKRAVPGIRMKEVIADLLNGVFNVDAPILRTFRTFLRGPAGLTRSFLAGRRRAFTPPVKYFLFGIACYYIVRWIFQWDPVDAAIEGATGRAVVETPANRVNHWMSRNVNLLLPLLVMLLATFDRLLFPRTGLRWVERLVHYLFTAGTYLLIASTLLLLVRVLPSIQFINFFIILAIIIWSCISLHRRGVWTAIKALVMVPVTFVLYILLSMMLVALLLGVPLAEVFVPPVR